MKTAAKKLHLELELYKIYNTDDILTSIEKMSDNTEAVFILNDSFVVSYLDKYIEAAINYKLPLSVPNIYQVEAGALMSFGFIPAEVGKQAARLAHQIIDNGVKPAELPVETAEFFLSINLRTTKKIDLVIPDSILQQEVSNRVSTQVITFIHELENTLKTTCHIYSLYSLKLKEQKLILSYLHSSQSAFDAISLLDKNGQEIIKFSRLEMITDEDLTDKSDDDVFKIPKDNQITYFSPIEIHKKSGEPLMTISFPLLNLTNGSVENIVTAVIRVKKIWHLIENIEIHKGQSFYIIDKLGNIIAHPNPSIVLKGTKVSIPNKNGITNGLNKKKHL